MLKYLLEKQKIIKEHQAHSNDSGSIFVQLALITFVISSLQAHVAENRCDKAAKVSLLAKIDARRKMLKYLRRKFPQSYVGVCEKLELRVKKG